MPRRKHFLPPEDEADALTRPCDHPGCAAAGLYRAPQARDRLNDYYWFCLDHVRDYNRTWNYCTGMSDAEVEAMIRQDTVWQRPTWPLGGWRVHEARMRDRVEAEFFADTEGGRAEGGRAEGGRHDGPARPATDEARALAELDLKAPVDLATIKARYKQLVKQHHPDANGGDRQSEEKLKQINHAYGVLKTCYAH